MANNNKQESLPQSSERITTPETSVSSTAFEQQEKLDETRSERVGETRNEDIERARQDVEKVHETEQSGNNQEKSVQSQEHLRPTPTSRDKVTAYHRVMHEAERHMSPAERKFSRFIHHPIVEQTSETLGATVARPNAILTGSICAFLFTLVIYLIARSYGYVLSGGETIASFVAGWLVGILGDYVRLLVTGKR